MDADSGSQSTDPTPPEGRGEAAGGELVQVCGPSSACQSFVRKDVSCQSLRTMDRHHAVFVQSSLGMTGRRGCGGSSACLGGVDPSVQHEPLHPQDRGRPQEATAEEPQGAHMKRWGRLHHSMARQPSTCQQRTAGLPHCRDVTTPCCCCWWFSRSPAVATRARCCARLCPCPATCSTSTRSTPSVRTPDHTLASASPPHPALSCGRCVMVTLCQARATTAWCTSVASGWTAPCTRSSGPGTRSSPRQRRRCDRRPHRASTTLLEHGESKPFLPVCVWAANGLWWCCHQVALREVYALAALQACPHLVSRQQHISNTSPSPTVIGPYPCTLRRFGAHLVLLRLLI